MTDVPNRTELLTLSRFFRQKFGRRIYKLPVDAGFTCPNRDGRRGWGGCTYCNHQSFSPALAHRRQSVSVQLRQARDRVRQSPRGRHAQFLAYFQAFSNTDGPVESLRQCYDSALAIADIVGLDIATRPDCVPNAVLDLLQSYSERTHVWLEIGLESSHDETLQRLNRGHGWREFEDALRRASGRHLQLCVHLILGLPGETPAMMRQTADRLGQLMAEIQAPAIGVKLHHLHIVRGTVLAQAYGAGRVLTLTPAAYVGLVCDVLERLPPQTVIHRWVGDTLEGV